MVYLPRDLCKTDIFLLFSFEEGTCRGFGQLAQSIFYYPVAFKNFSTSFFDNFSMMAFISTDQSNEELCEQEL